MSDRLLRCCLAAASLTLGFGAAGWAGAADWPNHLGPTQDAVSAETGLLTSWPEAGPPEQWRHDIGIGFAGVAVADGKVFLNDRQPNTAEILRVFDLECGEELWQYKYEARGRVNLPGSRSTPTVTDTHVYLTGALGHVTAVNRKTHKPDWAYNIYDDYPTPGNVFGYSPSPMLVDGLLLLSPTVVGQPVTIAVDPKTGEKVWESEAPIAATAHSHHTPVVRTIAGVRAIAARDRTHIYFLDIKTGKTIWKHEVYEVRGGPHVTIPPITVMPGQDKHVFVSNGYEDGSLMLEVTAGEAEGQFNIKELYRIRPGGQVHPPLYHDGHFYMNMNENANLRGRNPDGGLSCIDAKTGELKWHTKNDPNLNHGAITLVDGKIIAFDGNSGEVLLIKPNPEKFEVISKFVAIKPKNSGNNAWAPVVVSNGRLIVRDHQQIVCYDLRQQAAN